MEYKGRVVQESNFCVYSLVWRTARHKVINNILVSYWSEQAKRLLSLNILGVTQAPYGTYPAAKEKILILSERMLSVQQRAILCTLVQRSGTKKTGYQAAQPTRNTHAWHGAVMSYE